MAFMTLNIIVFENNRVLLNFAHFLFLALCYPFLLMKGLILLFLAFGDSSFEHILRRKIWVYGFDSVLSKALIEFLFNVSICCSFCNRIKN